MFSKQLVDISNLIHPCGDTYITVSNDYAMQMSNQQAFAFLFWVGDDCPEHLLLSEISTTLLTDTNDKEICNYWAPSGDIDELYVLDNDLVIGKTNTHFNCSGYINCPENPFKKVSVDSYYFVTFILSGKMIISFAGRNMNDIISHVLNTDTLGDSFYYERFLDRRQREFIPLLQ